ncbi:MAG TPA: aminotransferase class I/II-fold pyridoxal phosphate-dependent enzyme [Planctomycetota bacterium]|jgi:cystathionine beta-lyase/cystathionine gamma-synthase|nr:aminotransferase class I/II-fold pyridoxal phosphate-dependent enzyme [Planctomycetota bacterium]
MKKLRHYGSREDSRRGGPLAPDLTRSTTFEKGNAEEVRAVGVGEAPGEFYPRHGTPNGRMLEARLAELEGADGAVTFASGMAALHAIVFGLLRSGDRVAASREVYGGMTAMLREDAPRFGIEVRPFDPFDRRSVARVLDGGVNLVHVETPTNPLCRVVDLAPLAAAAKRAGSLLSVDATFCPPPFQNALAHGADLVMHSATKFLGGHSDALAGVVAGRHELLEPIEAFRLRTGGILGPDTAWLVQRSLGTLELRVRAESERAHRLAGYLEGIRSRGGRIDAVHYPGLPGHPDHAVAKRQMKSFGAVLAFEVAGGLEPARRVYDRFRVIRRAVSLGGIETLASLPVHTSHAMASPEERKHAGIAEGLIRLSVGLEPVEELEADLASALEG